MRHTIRTWFVLFVLGLAACTQAPVSEIPADDAPAPGPTDYGPAETYFVRHDAIGPGIDGSLANPFAEIADAVAAAGEGDIIYVFAGATTDAHTYGGVALKPGQQLIGSGVAFAPAELPAGLAPRITGESGPAVTLTRDNTVRGFRLRSRAQGVLGTNVGTLTLSDLHIEAAGVDGVHVIANDSNRVAIQADRITARAAKRIGFHVIVVDAASANLALAESVFEDNTGNAVQITLQGTGASTFALDDLSIRTLQSSGIRVFVGGEEQQYVEGRIRGATITSADPNTAGNGVAVIVEGDAAAAVEVTGNRVEQFGSFGIDLSARGGKGTLDATLEDNHVANPAAGALAGVRMLAGNGVPSESNILCLNVQLGVATQDALPAFQQESWRGTAIRIHTLPNADGVTQARRALESTIEGSAALAAHPAGSLSYQAAGCRLPSF